ncbi:MAG TPA: GAF domain-containing protein [Chryseolinea sp.]|nr:GAF domain-containing protein [Chryseolinea sp.]
MKEFFRQNLVRIAIGVNCVLIVLSVSLSLYNGKSMRRSLVLKEQSNFALQEVARVYQNIQLMDISSRGYALIRQPDYLFWTVKMARDRNVEIFLHLDSIFVAQNFTNPDRYQEVKKGLNDYTNMYEQMVLHLQAKEDSLYIDLLRKDLGRYFWDVFNPFSKNVNEFEESINEESISTYQRANTSNTVVQLLLVIIGIPTMIFVIYRLVREERSRRALLNSVADNNKKYLFNDGKQAASDETSIIESLIKDLQQSATFVNDISGGNYDARWEQLQNNLERNKNTLAGRLLSMRDEMKRQKDEDKKRMWATQGLSDLSQLIREHQNNIQELTFRSVTFIVNYVQVQQASLFVLENDENGDQFLNLSACYAFNRKKLLEKRINIGEGVVGQAFLERQTVVMTKVPQGYTTITSGLGDATPDYLAVVPMKYNEVVTAVLELAGFRILEDHEITFLEKAGEFIASAIANVQNNEKSKSMIDQMREQAEQMRAQEEELRQNLEELEATQEDMRRKGLKA